MGDSSINNPQQLCNRLPNFLKNNLGKKPNQIVDHSHFNEPIALRKNMGNSRVWADARDEVKLTSINQILDQAVRQKMNLQEAIFALSVAQIESGFNPDAAAATSSASGLGQFIDKTGDLYGLNSENRFEIDSSAKAVVSLLNNNLDQVSSIKDAQDKFVEAYSKYHDGTVVSEETREFAKQKIPNLMERFSDYILSDECLGKYIVSAPGDT